MRKILAIMALGILLACNNTPEGVLSPGDMENVLFDYHLAQSMIYDINYTEREKMSQAYIDAVFEKHGITQAEFDSSLVWYNRHSKEYHKIYENLKGRFEEMNKDLQLKNGNNDMMAVFSTGGDTTNIWGASKLMVLRENEILNKESFAIKSDTSFHKSDTYILMCKLNMLLENQSDRKEFVTIGMTLTYKNGTKIGTTRQAFSNGNIQITLNANDSVDVSKITGFFYFKGNSTYRSTAYIDDIQLIRMHKQQFELPKPNVDSTAIKTDTTEVEPIIDSIEHRRVPAETLIDINKKRERKIEIKAAPDVRTPNSYGKRKIIRKQ